MSPVPQALGACAQDTGIREENGCLLGQTPHQALRLVANVC